MNKAEESLAQRLHSLFFRVASNDPSDMDPESLYHYTTAVGLNGIISEGRIRGTNYGYLNDSSELTYGSEVAHRVLSDRLVTEQNRLVRAFLKRVGDRLSTAGAAIDFYVTCFCQPLNEEAVNDRLGQWRGYGSSLGRFCISFDVEALYDQDKARILDHHAGPVVYDQDRQKKKIERAINEAISTLLGGRVSNREFREAIADILVQKLLKEACFFKHYGFQEENEWRIVHFARDASSLHFQPAAGLLTPYVHMVAALGDPPALPITEITAGPTRIGALAKKSIELLLKRYSYSGVEVRGSTIPVRDLVS
jgi:Protein of unknown function (DUF2971)